MPPSHTCTTWIPKPRSCAGCRRQARNGFFAVVVTAATGWLVAVGPQAAAGTASLARAVVDELVNRDSDVDKRQDEAISALAAKVAPAEAIAAEVVKQLRATPSPRPRRPTGRQ